MHKHNKMAGETLQQPACALLLFLTHSVVDDALQAIGDAERGSSLSLGGREGNTEPKPESAEATQAQQQHEQQHAEQQHEQQQDAEQHQAQQREQQGKLQNVGHVQEQDVGQQGGGSHAGLQQESVGPSSFETHVPQEEAGHLVQGHSEPSSEPIQSLSQQNVGHQEGGERQQSQGGPHNDPFKSQDQQHDASTAHVSPSGGRIQDAGLREMGRQQTQDQGQSGPYDHSAGGVAGGQQQGGLPHTQGGPQDANIGHDPERDASQTRASDVIFDIEDSMDMTISEPARGTEEPSGVIRSPTADNDPSGMGADLELTLDSPSPQGDVRDTDGAPRAQDGDMALEESSNDIIMLESPPMEDSGLQQHNIARDAIEGSTHAPPPSEATPPTTAPTAPTALTTAAEPRPRNIAQEAPPSSHVAQEAPPPSHAHVGLAQENISSALAQESLHPEASPSSHAHVGLLQESIPSTEASWKPQGMHACMHAVHCIVLRHCVVQKLHRPPRPRPQVVPADPMPTWLR